MLLVHVFGCGRRKLNAAPRPICRYKLKWLLDNVPAVAAAAREGRLAFGTVDSWLIYKLTGGGGSLSEFINAKHLAKRKSKTYVFKDICLACSAILTQCLTRTPALAQAPWMAGSMSLTSAMHLAPTSWMCARLTGTGPRWRSLGSHPACCPRFAAMRRCMGEKGGGGRNMLLAAGASLGGSYCLPSLMLLHGHGSAASCMQLPRCCFLPLHSFSLPFVRRCRVIRDDGPLIGVPIAGCLGDQQAALLGQRCRVHEAKNTYGTGGFARQYGLIALHGLHGLDNFKGSIAPTPTSAHCSLLMSSRGSFDRSSPTPNCLNVNPKSKISAS